MNPPWWKRLLCELVATCTVTFFAAGAICTDRYSGGELGLTGTALAYALALAVMMAATRRISGGHVNPAVTLAAYLTGKIRAPLALLYVAAQVVGATLAGVLLLRTFAAEIWQPVSLGSPTLGAGVAPTTGLFIEAALTFVLVFVVLSVTVRDETAVGFFGFSAGAALLCGILIGGPLTGAALNPARAFGPALVSGTWSHQWVYWIGPLVGAILSAVAYSAVQADDSRTPAH
jgi:MIP family channel proteins